MYENPLGYYEMIRTYNSETERKKTHWPKGKKKLFQKKKLKKL